MILNSASIISAMTNKKVILFFSVTISWVAEIMGFSGADFNALI